ncbi:MAG: hypothetical protein D4S02_10000 [Rhodocyclaceae bacterium]|nr:MAG: hypothetical protein D4S02_10000 [Rhodocyclaceae bacterium]
MMNGRYSDWEIEMSLLGLRFQMLWLRIPLIGGLASLSKEQGSAGKWDGTWSNAEIRLCHRFKGYMSDMGRDAFNNYLSYLGKSGDAGRTPAPAWLKWSLAVAVMLESMAWSYALFPGLSESRIAGSSASFLALGIAAVIGLALLYFMHQAGGQAYRNHLIRECLRPAPTSGVAALQGKLAEIQAHQPQTSDDADPPQIQCLRRVGTETGIQSIVIAAVLLLAVAGYSTLVHLKNQARLQAAEAVTLEMPAGKPALPPGISGSAPSSAPVQAGDAGLGADLALGILFVATQMLGASIGFRHQLAAKQGMLAYRSTRGFATHEEYSAHHDGLIHHWADHWLKELHSAGGKRGAETGGGSHHSFREFLFLTRQDEIKYDLQNIPHREVKRDLTESRVESLLAKIAELKYQNQRAEAIALIQDLPEPEKSEVKARLQAQAAAHPDEMARRAAERQELEKIL